MLRRVLDMLRRNPSDTLLAERRVERDARIAQKLAERNAPPKTRPKVTMAYRSVEVPLHYR